MKQGKTNVHIKIKQILENKIQPKRQGKINYPSWRLYNKQNGVHLSSHRKICMYVPLRAQTCLSFLYGNKVLLLCTECIHA